MKTYEILLAQSDEEPYHPNAIRWVLEGKGYRVTPVLGTGPAMERLSEKNYDLVITDLFIILEKAKELYPEGMTILMLTAQWRMIMTVQAIQSATDDYLFVPFDMNELELRVATAFEKFELRRRRASQDRANEAIHDMMKTLSYDVRGSLLSMAATLKLLTQGYYGEMDEQAVLGLKKLFSRTVGLIGVTEECLGEALSVTGDLKMKGEVLDLSPVIFPVEKGFASEAINGRADGLNVR